MSIITTSNENFINININIQNYFNNNTNILNNYIIYYNVIKSPNRFLDPDQKYLGHECSICQENVDSLDTMSITNCGTNPHVFHKDCINAWILRASTCPNCRGHI